MASSATDFVTGQTYKDPKYDEHLALQERMRHPIAFHAEMMGDIMYLNLALQQPDAAHFVEAVVQEVNGHVKNNHWQLTKCSEVPPDVEVISSVWSLGCKRDITTNKIKKYKARLNLHGGKQVFGLNYYETYAPVVLSLGSSSTGLYVEWISSWPTLKLPLSVTCTWSYPRGYRFLRETQRTMC